MPKRLTRQFDQRPSLSVAGNHSPRLSYDQFRLFELIWKRTIASQMADARKQRVVVTIQADDAIFQATGTSIEFEGFLRAYVEGSDDQLPN